MLKRIQTAAIGLLLSFGSMAGFAAERTVDTSACAPVVTLMAGQGTAAASWAYEENIGPLTPSEISNDGVWIESKQVIRWGGTLSATPAEFRYSLSGRDGYYTLSGREASDGNLTQTGKESVRLTCDTAALPEQVAKPILSSVSGTRTPLSITVSTNTLDATIHYTLDASTPTTSSPVYSGAVSLDQATYFKAIAVKEGYRTSDVVEAFYAAPVRKLFDTLTQTATTATCNPTITVAVAPTAQAKSYGVALRLPFGAMPLVISDNGTWDPETEQIKWGIYADTSARDLSFKLTGPDATYSLSAEASFGGFSEQPSKTLAVVQDCIPPQALKPILSPAKGRVPVSVSIKSETEDAIIRYTLDGAVPTTSSALYEGPITLSEPATLQAVAFKEGLEESEVAQGEYLTGTRPKAIIVAGGGPYEGNALWPATVKVSQYAYNALLYQGYDKEDIFLISPVDDIDFDGNGDLDDVDALATVDNLKAAITDWALNASEVMVYLTDHGGYGEFVLNKTSETAQFVSVGELDVWFDELQSVMTGPLTFIYDACQSGTFVEGLLPPEGASRIVLTSASNEPALFLEGGALSFSYQFWAAVFYKGKFYDAYLSATKQMEGDQRPLLDANGNGIANEKEDKFLVRDIVIGRGAVAASVPPELKGVSSPISLNGETSALIEVGEVVSLNPIDRVWAVMVPPNFRARRADAPVTELPSFELSDVDGDGRYGATYTRFTKNGRYKIQLYARDNQGVISIPASTEVNQLLGETVPNAAPFAQDAAYTIQEDSLLEGLLAADDDDGDSLTYAVVSDGEFGTVSLTDLSQGTFKYRAHANTNGLDSFTFVANDGVSDSNIATVSITLVEKEDRPIANDQRYVVEPGEIVQSMLPGEDGDGDSLFFEITAEPSFGSLTLDDAVTGAFTFNSEGASGTIAFEYNVSDGKAVSAPGVIEIFIKRGFNTPPSLNACNLVVQEDSELTDQLTGTDEDGDPLTFKLIGGPAEGTAELSAEGKLNYAPNANYFGTDVIRIIINDGYENSAPADCEIIVNPVNDAPVALSNSITVFDAAGYTGTLRADDVDQDAVTFEWVTGPTKGQIEWIDSTVGTFKYTPASAENGTDAFRFNVNDGLLTSEPASVSVSIRVPQASLTRSVIDDACIVAVSIEVDPVDSVKSQFIAEQLPSGAVPEDISDDGIWEKESQTIRWGGFNDNIARTLNYRFTTDDGDQALIGKGSFDGWTQIVKGPESVRINCDGARVAKPVITPASGSRAPLDMGINSETEGARLYYTVDGSEPTEDGILYTGPVSLDGPAKVRARGYKEALYRSQEARAKFRPANPKKAVLVIGGPINNGNALWSSTLKVARHAYSALLYQGYEKDEIQVLAPSLELDLDGNEDFDDIDAVATNEAIENSIRTWASDASELLFYMVGHGGDNRFQITLGGEFLEVGSLDAWLDAYQSKTGARTIVIYDACRSGSFLADLTGLPEVERLILTSSSESEPAWFIDQGVLSFSFQFWSAVFGKANLGDAYRQAQSLMKKYQTGLIDVNGDGVADDLAIDGANILLGRGAVTAAFEPEIKGAVNPQDIGGNSVAFLTVTGVTSVNPVDRVWAVVLPPGYGGSDPDVPVLSVAEVELAPNDEGGFSATYGDFEQAGLYEIVFYVQDDQGLISRPAYSQVLKGEGSFSADTDGDGIADANDLCPAIADDQQDEDQDGLGNACDNDDDNDGTADEEDAFPLDSKEQLDTDGDGIGNVADDDDDGDSVLDSDDAAPLDANVYEVEADEDGDGIADKVDNCVYVANSDQKNNDNDGVGDLCDNDDDNDGIVDQLDSNPFAPDGTNLLIGADTDDDGVKDNADNCESLANADQTDTDSDGDGDACDSDDDNDGVNDDDDDFPTNPSESNDSDGDGFGDNSDAFPDDSTESADSDGDSVGDNADNCPSLSNLDQTNTDGDAEGDACDSDDDNDGFSDDQEELDGTNPLNRFSCKTGCFSFDVDGNSEAKPLTDGLLVIRHLFGFSGESLTSGAVSGEASRGSSEAIAGYLIDADSELDIDGDGESKPLTDGLLLIRYLFGFSGASLISGAIGDGAERDTAEEVEAYIQARVPVQ